MLTCEQIVEHAKAMDIPVTRANYVDLSGLICQKAASVPLPAMEFDLEMAFHQKMTTEVPEYDERGRGFNWCTEPDDWTDMLVSLVTQWQYNAAVRIWLNKQQEAGNE